MKLYDICSSYNKAKNHANLLFSLGLEVLVNKQKLSINNSKIDDSRFDNA